MSKRNKRHRATLERAQQQYPQGGTVIPNALIQQFMAQIQAQSKQQQGQNAFSPGKPLDPQNVNPGGLPIAFRYPVAYNVSGIDRTLGNPDIAPFQQLRNLADLYEGIQLCEKVWLDLIPRLQLKITLRQELVSDTNTDDKYQKQIAAYQTFFEKPDGVNDLHSWLRIAITEQLQLDALYIHKQKTRGKQLQALNIIAGDTMKVLLDDWGRVMGYQQFPWGIPGEIFTPDQMLYFRESPRANTPYGKSRVERILMRVNQALRKEKKDLAYFTEGNIPHAIMEVPETSQWTPDQIEAFEAMWNSLIAGNVQQQVRVKFTQPGMKYSPLEQYQLLSDFDQFILNIATAAYGISLADLSFTGDIHKSSDDGQQNMLGRRTIYPLVGMYGMLLTSVIRDDFKDPRFVATFTGFEEQEDLQAMVAAYAQAAQGGLIGITDATNALKFPQPKDAPYIGRILMSKDGPMFLDDMASDEWRKAAMEAQLAGYQAVTSPPEQQQSGEQGNGKEAQQKTGTQSGKESDTGDEEGNGATNNRVFAVDGQQAGRDSHPLEDSNRMDNNGLQRSIYDDLRKWRTRALDDIKSGKPFRPFVSQCIPQEQYTVIRDELQRCTNVDEVRALFERAKGGAYGPGEWQNTDKEIQQHLATLKSQGVTQVRWQTTVGACDTCTMNDQEVRPLGQPFLSGHILPPGHPNCVCTVVPVHDDGLQRYNENHDARGRFATGGGGGSSSGGGGGGAAKSGRRKSKVLVQGEHVVDPNVFAQASLQQFGAGQTAYETYKTTINGQEYFAKKIAPTDPALKRELLGRQLALDMGMADRTLPTGVLSHNDGATYLVQPWIGNGKPLCAVTDANQARLFQSMSPADLTRMQLHEYILQDFDRHSGNYMVDKTAGKLLAMDFGYSGRGPADNFDVNYELGLPHEAALNVDSSVLTVHLMNREPSFTLSQSVLQQTSAQLATMYAHVQASGVYDNQALTRFGQRMALVRSMSTRPNVTIHDMNWQSQGADMLPPVGGGK